jgi:uncharacterized protein YqhQ
MAASSRIGGQAVPEGVMLRGPGGWAVAVRRPDRTIAVVSHPLGEQRSRSLWQRPFFRGFYTLVTALPLGMRAMRWALTQLQPAPLVISRNRSRVQNAGSMVLAIGFAFLLFGLLPAYLATVITPGVGWGRLTEPVLRTLTIVAYIAAIGLLPDMRRVFAYHGAEHQVVGAHELGKAVTVPAAARSSRFHPRCGTTFVIIVALVDGLLRAARPDLPGPSAVLRLVELPLAITLSYELLQLAVERPHRWWARVLLAPGKGLQRLTTRQPDDSQLEVACVALDAVLALENQDQQQDDEKQYDDSASDVHRALLSTS